MLNILRRVASEKRAAAELYRAIVERSREPVFYAGLGVADTFDGRFDLVVLHGWMVLDALRAAGLGDLEDRVMRDLLASFEEGLRDQGAGDMSIGRRSKAMTSALFGRMKRYEGASDEAALAEALLRNLYRDGVGREDCARAMAHYIADSRKALTGAALAEGVAAFAPPPRAVEIVR